LQLKFLANLMLGTEHLWPATFICWNIISNVSALGSSFCEVIRSWGRALLNGIRALVKSERCFFFTTWEWKNVLWTRKWAFTRHQIRQWPELGLPTSHFLTVTRNVKNIVLLFTSLWHLVITA
jgi:hypothetical protein